MAVSKDRQALIDVLIERNRDFLTGQLTEVSSGKSFRFTREGDTYTILEYKWLKDIMGKEHCLSFPAVSVTFTEFTHEEIIGNMERIGKVCDALIDKIERKS